MLKFIRLFRFVFYAMSTMRRWEEATGLSVSPLLRIIDEAGRVGRSEGLFNSRNAAEAYTELFDQLIDTINEALPDHEMGSATCRYEQVAGPLWRIVITREVAE